MARSNNRGLPIDQGTGKVIPKAINSRLDASQFVSRPQHDGSVGSTVSLGSIPSGGLGAANRDVRVGPMPPIPLGAIFG